MHAGLIRLDRSSFALGRARGAARAGYIVERLQHAKAKVRSAAVKALGAPCFGQARGAARRGYCRQGYPVLSNTK